MLEEKKELEEYGIIVKDEYFTFACKRDVATLFNKVNKLNKLYIRR